MQKSKAMKESTTLTVKNLHKAIKMLKEQSKIPFITHMATKENISAAFKKSNTVRIFFYNGIPVHKDKEIPKDIVRVYMSDGTSKDVPFVTPPLSYTLNSPKKNERRKNTHNNYVC